MTYLIASDRAAPYPWPPSRSAYLQQRHPLHLLISLQQALLQVRDPSGCRSAPPSAGRSDDGVGSRQRGTLPLLGQLLGRLVVLH